MPVKGRKAGSRKRFVHGGPIANPRIAFGNGASEVTESLGEAAIEETRVKRSAPMMHEPNDGTHPEGANACEGRVTPRPIGMLEPVWRSALT